VRLSEVINNALLEGASYDSVNVTARLRAFLIESGWPVEVASGVSIRNTGGTYTAYYPSRLARAVNDLEYGTETTPPNPAIRNFLTNRIGTKDLAKGISLSLKSSGIV
jgi:hypothetical protein